MKGFLCKTCNYIAFDSAPDKCPVCGSPKQVFEETDKIQTAENEGPKEKHVPVINIVNKCGLAGDCCTDVHAKIGETLHPMEQEHFIVSADYYVDKKWVFRARLSPGCNPVVSAHLKAKSGKVAVVEFCNLHGHWIGEIDL